MSYKIGHATLLVFENVRIRAADLLRAFAECEDDLPEFHLFDKLEGHDPKKLATAAVLRGEAGAEIPLKHFAWSGGRDLDALVNVIGPVVLGHVQVVYVWEDGDSFSGLAIKDGKVAACDVVQALALPPGW